MTLLRAAPCLTLLPNDKMLEESKLKAFADDKVIWTQKLKFVLGKIEHIVGKGEDAGYQHFLIFYNVFKSLLIQYS